MLRKTTPFTAVAFLTICSFSGISQAADKHTALALEHAASSSVHAEHGDMDQFTEDLKEALHHSKMASTLHHDRHMHTLTAAKHLKAALDFIDKKDSKKAQIHANKAVIHIHKSLDN